MDSQDTSSQNDQLDESLWDSPSKPESKPAKPAYQDQEARDGSLRQELDHVRQVNEAIEGVIQSLRKAKDNMKVVYATIPLSVAC